MLPVAAAADSVIALLKSVAVSSSGVLLVYTFAAPLKLGKTAILCSTSPYILYVTGAITAHWQQRFAVQLQKVYRVYRTLQVPVSPGELGGKVF